MPENSQLPTAHWNTIIHRAPGLGQDLDWLKSLHAEKILLVTRDRTTQRRLRLQTLTDARFVVLTEDEASAAAQIQALQERVNTLEAEKAEAEKRAEQVELQLKETELQLRNSLNNTIKQEIGNATQQLEAVLSLQSFFGNGELLPTMHGWPISPDFARYLIELLEKNEYELILEFGSGTSTILIAKALAKIRLRRPDKLVSVQVAFEHLQKYHSKTQALLKREEFVQAVQLTLAPLQPYQARNGNTYSYYACHDKLAELSASISSMARVLVVVDGPPASTGKHARYPCVPVVLEHFENIHLDILLDDYRRVDEQEVGNQWKSDLKNNGYEVLYEKLPFEKGGLLVTAYPDHSIPLKSK